MGKGTRNAVLLAVSMPTAALFGYAVATGSYIAAGALAAAGVLLHLLLRSR